MSRWIAAFACLALGPACTYQGTPVPVAGETQALQGDWEGTYSSEGTGRTGSIAFRLDAGRDSAYGDVLMVPVRAEELRGPGFPESPRLFRPMNRLLRISFVRCEDGEVTGRLEPYEDPETGERIYTTFEGRLTGQVFQGTFSTLYPGSTHPVSGKWSVRRRQP